MCENVPSGEAARGVLAAAPDQIMELAVF